MSAEAIEASQEQLGKALDRARMGEDKDLATRVRDAGERLIRLLYGLLKMTELHSLDNSAFIKPSVEFSEVSENLVNLLGVIHIVTVEDQVFVNDIRIRFGRASNASSLSEELSPHQVGGMSFHQVPNPEQVKKLIHLFASEPDVDMPRAKLIEKLTDENISFIDLLGVYRFRISGESTQATVHDIQKVSAKASVLVEEAWDNLGSNRTPNPLPLRRAVTDILEHSKSDVSGLQENPKSTNKYGDHALQVCRLSLLLAAAANLSEENIQDLGVAAMFHDMGYAAREGADVSKGEEGFAPPFERHAAAGSRMLLRQRGFHQAKINRALSALEHHRDYTYEGGKPTLFARIIRIAEDFSNMTSRRGGGYNPHEALSRMSAAAGTQYDPHLIQIFINRMGKYPPGTILEVEVELSTGKYIFVMVSSSLCEGKDEFDKPLCRVLKLHDGTLCPEPHNKRIVNLRKKGKVLRVLNDY
jgi:hypothetical protein